MATIQIQGDYEKRNGIYYELELDAVPLGEGGMGKVYEGICINERTGVRRPVAIKCMYSDLPSPVIERARREASIQLRNDNLVEMLGFIETKQRDSFGSFVSHYHVVSELLEGIMLDDLLNGKVVGKDGALIPFAQELLTEREKNPYKFAIRVIRCILSGVMALHDAGYIHRDIDPTNIMVTRDGKIKLIDFGIAKQLQNLNTQDKSLTSTGQFLGKALYAAPELVVGDVRHQDRTTDIYAIGILFYQLVVGALPFDGPTHEVLDKQLHAKLPLQNIKVREVRKVIAKATAKKQDQRYASAAEMRVDIDRLSRTDLKPSFDFHVLIPWISVAAASVILLVAVWAIIGYVEQYQPATPQTEDLIADQTDEPQPPVTIEVSDNDRFNEAKQMLQTSQQTHEGLQQMNRLSEKGFSDATYFLSQLYFKSNKEEEAAQQSEMISKVREAAHVEPDNVKAHALLEKAVWQDSTNVEALYELALDYIGGKARNEAVERNMQMAEQYLKQALSEAERTGNVQYQERISKTIETYYHK